MTHDAQSLLKGNKEFALAFARDEKSRMATLANGQQPKVFWIGCSDSRLPETVITNASPGDLFVHRNVANMVQPGDASMAAALTFAIDTLQVEHVIVCGHSDCGGVTAVCDHHVQGDLAAWLSPLQDLYKAHQTSLDTMAQTDQCQELSELSVLAQINHLSSFASVSKAIEHGKLTLHAWMYDVATGELTDLQAD